MDPMVLLLEVKLLTISMTGASLVGARESTSILFSVLHKVRYSAFC